MARQLTRASAMVIGAAAILSVGTATGAVASGLIQGSQIADWAITGPKIHPGTVDGTKLSPYVQGQIPLGVATGQLVKDTTATAVPITTLGGPFATGATTAKSFTLPAGTYLVSSYGFFANPTAATPTAPTTTFPTLELAVRGQDGTTWGADYGTCFAPPAVNQYTEVTCQSTRVITVPAGGITVKIQLFGYNANRSSSMSGDYTGSVDVSAVRVK